MPPGFGGEFQATFCEFFFNTLLPPYFRHTQEEKQISAIGLTKEVACSGKRNQLRHIPAFHPEALHLFAQYPAQVARAAKNQLGPWHKKNHTHRATNNSSYPKWGAQDQATQRVRVGCLLGPVVCQGSQRTRGLAGGQASNWLCFVLP